MFYLRPAGADPRSTKINSVNVKRLLENERINNELEIEKGEIKMAQTIMEQIGDQINVTAHKASQAASAVGDVLEDGVTAARRAAKHASRTASELKRDTKKRIQGHPFEIVAATFAAGITTGVAIGWLIRQRRS